MPRLHPSQVTYKGIRSETQAAVKDAARAAGMTIGAWVEKALLYAINNPAAVNGGADLPQTVVERLRKCETMLGFLIDDYYDRHPGARPQPQAITHTRRIAESLSVR
jgi:hypothetical protein